MSITFDKKTWQYAEFSTIYREDQLFSKLNITALFFNIITQKNPFSIIKTIL